MPAMWVYAGKQRILHGGSDLHFFYSHLAVLDRVFISSDAYRYEYGERLSKLVADLESPPPEGIHPGFFRDASFQQFFTKMMRMDGPGPHPEYASPLDSILHLPKTDAVHMCLNYTEIVAKTMLDTRWAERYGLSFKDTMALPYWQFLQLRDILYQHHVETAASSREDALSKEIGKLTESLNDMQTTPG